MQIKNIDRARQLNDFSNLMGGKISMTDIDGIYDCDGKGWLILETKYLSKELPASQERTIERLVKDTGCKGEKLSIGVVVEHNISNANDHVPCAICKVRKYYYSTNLRWVIPPIEMTFDECITLFYNHVEVYYEKSIRAI